MNIFKGSTVLTVLVTLLLSGWPSASQTWESIQESWADLAFRGGQKPHRASLYFGQVFRSFSGSIPAWP